MTGVIARTKVPGFERLLWRACRGNVFLRSVAISTQLRDPSTNESLEKDVFIIFFQGEQLENRVRRICDGCARVCGCLCLCAFAFAFARVRVRLRSCVEAGSWASVLGLLVRFARQPCSPISATTPPCTLAPVWLPSVARCSRVSTLGSRICSV